MLRDFVIFVTHEAAIERDVGNAGCKMYFGLLELKFLIVGDRSAEEGLDGRNTVGGVVFALLT